MEDFEQEYIGMLAGEDDTDLTILKTEPESEVKKMEEKGYPKIQWSIFIKNGKDQQIVVRADTVEEFKTLRTQVMGVIGELVVESSPVSTPATPAQTGVNCAKCGAPANRKSGTSKNGKPYNAIFCSTDDRTHTVWL